jgi:hypothetical protein
MHRLTWPAYAMLPRMAKSGGDKKKAAAEPRRAMRARSVSDMLPEVGGAAFRRFGFVQSSIVSRWREIVGERYSKVSSPESIRFPPGKRSAGVLNLVVEGAHAPMMQHVAPVIVERVNRFFGYNAVSASPSSKARLRSRRSRRGSRRRRFGPFRTISATACAPFPIRSCARCSKRLHKASRQAKRAPAT